jgi:PP-loop superfamily ATP-utilizing enzyme
MSSPDVLASPPSAQQRERELIGWLQAHDSLLLGFSGGVDSAYLACVAVDAVGAERFLAVIGRSASYPAEQWQTARDVAARAGITVLEVDTHEMDDPRYVANPTNRCYFCKTELWSVLERVRAERALREFGVTGNLRVRHHGDTARVEMDLAQLEHWQRADRSAQLCDAVRGAGFANVVLDPRGFRSGSLNVLAGVVTDRGDSAPLSGT